MPEDFMPNNPTELEVFYPVILHELSKKNQLASGEVAFCTEDQKIYFKLGDTEARSYVGLKENEVRQLIKEAQLDPSSLSLYWDDKNDKTDDDLFKPVVLSTAASAANLTNGEMAFCTEDKKIYFKTGNNDVQTYGGLTRKEITTLIENSLSWNDKNEETEDPAFKPVFLANKAATVNLTNGEMAFCVEDKKIYLKYGNNEVMSYGGITKEEFTTLIESAVSWDDKNDETANDPFKPVVLSTAAATVNLTNGEVAFCTEDKKIYFKTGNNDVQTYGGLTREEITTLIESSVSWDDKNDETEDISFKPVILSTAAAAETLTNGEMAFCTEDKKIYLKIGDSDVDVYGGKRFTWTIV